MDEVVVDSNLIVASFLSKDQFHQEGKAYTEALQRGDYRFHLSTLVIVEVVSGVSRQVRRYKPAFVERVRRSIDVWERSGGIILYELNRDRIQFAASAAERYGLRSLDAIHAALADELALPLKTCDQDVLTRYPGASQ